MVQQILVVVQALLCYSAGPHTDPLRDGFQATSLDSDEVVRILDACIRHQDHFNGFKVAAMVLLGTSMGFRGKLCSCCLLMKFCVITCCVAMQVMI